MRAYFDICAKYFYGIAGRTERCEGGHQPSTLNHLLTFRPPTTSILRCPFFTVNCRNQRLLKQKSKLPCSLMIALVRSSGLQTVHAGCDQYCRLTDRKFGVPPLGGLASEYANAPDLLQPYFGSGTAPPEAVTMQLEFKVKVQYPNVDEDNSNENVDRFRSLNSASLREGEMVELIANGWLSHVAAPGTGALQLHGYR